MLSSYCSTRTCQNENFIAQTSWYRYWLFSYWYLNSSLFSSSPIIDLLVNDLNNVLMDLRDNDAPFITRTVKCRPNASWYTDELRYMKRESRRFERRWISSKLEIHKQLLKEHCKQYNLAIKYAEETYYQKQFADRDSKRLLQTIFKKCVNRLHRNLFLLILLTMNLPLASLISSVTRSKGLNEILSTQMNWIFLVLILTNVVLYSLIFRWYLKKLFMTLIWNHHPQHVLLIPSRHSYWKICQRTFANNHLIVNLSFMNGKFPDTLKSELIYNTTDKETDAGLRNTYKLRPCCQPIISRITQSRKQQSSW